MGDPSLLVNAGWVQTGSNRRLPRCGRGALPLSYARVAGEIGIEPMAACASDRRSTHAELLAEPRYRVDLAGLEPTASALQVRCSPVLSYRPGVPLASLASGYSITLEQASTRPNVQCEPSSSED